jgi:hypothetical protein
MEFKEIKGERSRTYVFAQGEYTVKNAVGLCVRPSGSHRVEDAQGGKHIVPSGWMAIQVEADNWSL